MQSLRNSSLSIKDSPYVFKYEEYSTTGYIPEKGELINYTDEENTLHSVIGDGEHNIRECTELPSPIAVVEIRALQGEEKELMEARGAAGIKRKIFLHRTIVESATSKRYKERHALRIARKKSKAEMKAEAEAAATPPEETPS